MAESVGWTGTEGFDWTWSLYPRIRACWATLEQSEGSCFSFVTTLPRMATGGKVYRSRSSQGRLSTSTTQARESGAGDTN